MEEEKVKKPKVDYHQMIMNQAYDLWQKDGDGRSESMEDWFERLSDLQKDAVALGKFNQQVCNGGFSQWVDNGYMNVQFKQLQQALTRLPECEVVKTVQDILNKFEKIAERNEWGEGSYTEENQEECCECNGSGYVTNVDGKEISCDYCNDGQVDYDEEIYYAQELFSDLNNSKLDDLYYTIDEEFLKVCETYFKRIKIEKIEIDYSHKKMKPIRIEKPKVKLVGADGNVFNIIGLVQQALKKANWTPEEIQKVREEMTSGNYDNALQTVMKYCEVY